MSYVTMKGRGGNKEMVGWLNGWTETGRWVKGAQKCLEITLSLESEIN